MKKTLATIGLAGFVTLLTATFGLAEYSAAGSGNFPYFQLGAVIVGGVIIVSLKTKYQEMYMTETMGAFALYTTMISLFTAPVVNLIKDLVA